MNNADDRIKELIAITKAESNLQLMQEALSLFQWAVEQAQLSRPIGCIDGGQFLHYQSPLLHTARTS